ncbi:hypothetical protein C5N14_13720 [Micromonospora sp. MW-13]|uniref:hypothetical protein n=1 Tax=Micromonospora sp. MW-13 TaxID=2094022 RepID=UPI000EE482AD|nr:hypothetical protein [Micromonospora sp. MW-13]RGC68440.1 hypothetical protein C5N14_13720 [Micromonospora sp. MW-13]
MYVIGIDPGPLPGIVRLQLKVVGDKWSGQSAQLVDVQALQVTPGLLGTVLEGINAATEVEVVAYERFVVGRRAGQSSSAAAGAKTRNMIGELEAWAGAGRWRRVYARSAAEVKPWATDTRLGAAGLLDLTKGMRHARDAARHALFCAVRDCGLADPLSRKAGAL